MHMSLPARALDPSRALMQYIHTAWSHEQGFFGENIYAISRSADGYLWIGTDTGLVRFDETGFASIRRPIANQPPIGRVRGLLSDADGFLWILLEDRRLLLYLDGLFSDAFAVYHTPPVTITAISLDRQNRALFSNIGNVTLRGRKWQARADRSSGIGAAYGRLHRRVDGWSDLDGHARCGALCIRTWACCQNRFRVGRREDQCLDG